MIIPLLVISDNIRVVHLIVFNNDGTIEWFSQFRGKVFGIVPNEVWGSPPKFRPRFQPGVFDKL